MSAAEPPASAAAGGEPVRIEVAGLAVYAHLGVTAAEREVGQRVVLDVALELRGCRATVSDELPDTIDYGAVARSVAEAAAGSSHRTLERLCGSLADLLAERFSPDSVTVRAAKPEPPMDLAVEEVAVELTRDRA